MLLQAALVPKDHWGWIDVESTAQAWIDRLPQIIEAGATWLTDHQPAITTAAALLALFRPWALLGYFRGLRKNAPRIEFGIERVGELIGENVDIVLKVANVGGSVASDVRLTWNQRSRCTMKPVPQPLMLLIGEHRLFEFSVHPLDLIMGHTDDRNLGWLVLTYSEGGWRRKRSGRSLVVAHSTPIPLDLRRIPRKQLREIIPIIGKIADERSEKQRTRQFNEWLQRAKADLVERGIPVEAEQDGDDVLGRLLGELGSRGWAWDYAPGGFGYEVVADKTWPPSSSLRIRFSASTPEDAAALVLARAIEEDELKAGTGSVQKDAVPEGWRRWWRRMTGGR